MREFKSFGGTLRTASCSSFLFSLLVLSAAGAAAEAAPQVEEGELFVAVVDYFADHTSETLYHLQRDNGTLVWLELSEDMAGGLTSGQRVRAQGAVFRDATGGDTLSVDEITIIDAGDDDSALRVSGTRAAIVIRTNFSDAAVSCSQNTIGNIMWSGSLNVNELFQETSFGAVSFPPDTDADGDIDIVDVTIPRSVTEVCNNTNYTAWATAARTAASALGVNIGLYRHRIYVIPQSIEVRCGWAGMGSVGCGTSCDVWVTTCGTPDVYAHELGHNLGMSHARTDRNNNGFNPAAEPNTDCEYCDTSSIMGYGGIGWRHFDSVHKVQMDWIPTARIVDVSQSGAFTLTAVERDPATPPAPPSGVQTIRVPIPGVANWHYYVSYRAALGDYSGNLPNSGSSAARNRTSIHRRSTGSAYSYLVTTLANGQTFDDGQGVRIVQSSSGSDYASLNVTIGQDTAGACCTGATCQQTETAGACAALAFVCDAATNVLPECGGPCGTTCFGDVNGDGVVTAGDRGFVSANIGGTDYASLCQYDLDGNGTINAGDRGFVSAGIGSCGQLPPHQNGSGLNAAGSGPDNRFSAPVFRGAGTSCATACP